jgi:hypothetical protein
VLYPIDYISFLVTAHLSGLPAWLPCLQDRFRDFTFDPVRFPVNAMREFVAR